MGLLAPKSSVLPTAPFSTQSPVFTFIPCQEYPVAALLIFHLPSLACPPDPQWSRKRHNPDCHMPPISSSKHIGGSLLPLVQWRQKLPHGSQDRIPSHRTLSLPELQAADPSVPQMLFPRCLSTTRGFWTFWPSPSALFLQSLPQSWFLWSCWLKEKPLLCAFMMPCKQGKVKVFWNPDTGELSFRKRAQS